MPRSWPFSPYCRAYAVPFASRHARVSPNNSRPPPPSLCANRCSADLCLLEISAAIQYFGERRRGGDESKKKEKDRWELGHEGCTRLTRRINACFPKSPNVAATILECCLLQRWLKRRGGEGATPSTRAPSHFQPTPFSDPGDAEQPR